MDTGIKKAFYSFLENSQETEAAIISSTKASWGGSGYSVELFPDGHYRVLWDGQIGNLYESPGLIVEIPPLGEEEYDEENGHFFENAIGELEERFDNLCFVAEQGESAR